MKRILGWIGTIAVLVLVRAIAVNFKPLQDLETSLAPHRRLLLSGPIAMTVLGGLLLLGGGLAMVLTRGQPMRHEEVEALVRSSRDRAAQPYAWRRSSYRI